MGRGAHPTFLKLSIFLFYRMLGDGLYPSTLASTPLLFSFFCLYIIIILYNSLKFLKNNNKIYNNMILTKEEEKEIFNNFKIL